jgi:Ca-activated chloride channel family protein
MTFTNPYMLLLTIPAALVVIYFYFTQLRLLRTLRTSVSQRFIGRVTVYNKITLTIHSFILFILIFLLILSSSGPEIQSGVKVPATQSNVILVIDASFSMFAADITTADAEESPSRLDYCRTLSLSLIENLSENRFGLITFSGDAVLHAGPTDDHFSLRQFINNVSIHNYSFTGSNFLKPLERIVQLSEADNSSSYQAIILSDGEERSSPSINRVLGALKKQGVTIHTVAVGSKSGGAVDLYEPDDVFDRKEEKKIYKSFTTYRKDGLLKKIARRTNGSFFLEEDESTLDNLIGEIKETEKNAQTFVKEGSTSISNTILTVFFILFLFDSFFAIPLYSYIQKATGND